MLLLVVIFLAAFEGWACAAMVVKYDLNDEYNSSNFIQRVATACQLQQISSFQERDQRMLVS